VSDGIVAPAARSNGNTRRRPFLGPYLIAQSSAVRLMGLRSLIPDPAPAESNTRTHSACPDMLAIATPARWRGGVSHRSIWSSPDSLRLRTGVTAVPQIFLQSYAYASAAVPLTPAGERLVIEDDDRDDVAHVPTKTEEVHGFFSGLFASN